MYCRFVTSMPLPIVGLYMERKALRLRLSVPLCVYGPSYVGLYVQYVRRAWLHGCSSSTGLLSTCRCKLMSNLARVWVIFIGFWLIFYLNFSSSLRNASVLFLADWQLCMESYTLVRTAVSLEIVGNLATLTPVRLGQQPSDCSTDK